MLKAEEVVQHLKYQRALLDGLADDMQREHALVEYLAALDELCHIMASFDLVIRYYESQK